MKIADWVIIFRKSIQDYHLTNSVNTKITNPYPNNTIKHFIYLKGWIDTIQWHLEDIIREPKIDPRKALKIKRRIDKTNQQRTELVEYIDDWFLRKYSKIVPRGASINTESPGWAIDRLSILELKIFHMQIEAQRSDATSTHRARCQVKLDVLLMQRVDLSTAITELLGDIAIGKKYMKVYKQMKMYNDKNTNPVLYRRKKKKG